MRAGLLTLVLAVLAGGSFLDEVSTQKEALALLATGAHAPDEQDVLVALDRAWWDASKQMLRTMRQAGAAVGTMQEVRSTATRIRDQATEIINLMRVGANAEETVVNAAFQWAQRPDFLYLNVKFASRIDGPVTCLNVDQEKVTFTNESVYFEGIGRQKPKTFRLNLTFHSEIDPDASSWSFGSVGRMSITIAKKEVATWPRLLKTKAKPKNMYSWYERQTALDEEVRKEKKEREKDEEERKKQAAAAEEKSKKNEPSAPPPADGAPPPAMRTNGADGAATAATGDAAAGSSDEGGGKKKGGKKKKKKKPAAEKDEV